MMVSLNLVELKMKNGSDRIKLQSFDRIPEKTISSKITQLTSITNEMVKGQPLIKDFLIEIKKFFDNLYYSCS